MPAAQPVEAEVVNETQHPRFCGAMPLVHFNMGTTFQSPCFWMIVGAVGALAVVYMVQRRK